jgi:multiple sugar transport system ATP-binding protein
LTAAVELRRVDKVYSDGTRAVTGLDLRIDPGELMVVVGPSGCGKTTTLRMTAGLEDVTAGEISIGDQVVNALDPSERDVAMVFQNYALYPHMTVFDNLAFPLRARGVSRSEVRRRVEQTARLLELEDQLMRKPRALSGGQRQRVAMGRAIVREPQVFLMDEPLSNLDARLRTDMRAEISELQRELGVTTMYVTHDQLEAMTMGTRIAVLREGVLQQCGTPQGIYDCPDNIFVATFIGSPTMNLLPGTIVRIGDSMQCVHGADCIAFVHDDLAAAILPYVNNDVVIGVRPEHLTDAGHASGEPLVRGRVRLIELLGSEQLVRVELPTGVVVTARFNARTRVAVGDVAELHVAPEDLHYFNPATGRAIRH